MTTTRGCSPTLGGRYTILKALGKGTYGQVFLCHDTKTEVQVAIKVARAEPAYWRAAIGEIEVLRKLVNNTETLNMMCYFNHGGCLCIVTEVLQMSLFDVLHERGCIPLPLSDVRIIAERVLRALTALHGVGYMHCDVKPENIMLRPSATHLGVEQDFNGTCLIDFGAVRKFDDNRYYDIQSLWYRAPEVALCLPYTSLIDSWSVGCLLFELCTGEPLFRVASPQELLNLIRRTVGLPLQERPVYDSGCPTECVAWGGVSVDAESNIHCLISRRRSEFVEGCVSPQSIAEEKSLVNLIARLLEPDVSKRLSCADALGHPFLNRRNVQGRRAEPVKFLMGGDGESALCAALPSTGFSPRCVLRPLGGNTCQWEEPPEFAVQACQQQLPFPTNSCTGIPVVGLFGHSAGAVITSAQPPLASGIPGSSLQLYLPPVACPQEVPTGRSAPLQVRHRQVHVPPLYVAGRGCAIAHPFPNYPNMGARNASRGCASLSTCNVDGTCNPVLTAVGVPHHVSLRVVPAPSCGALPTTYDLLVGNPERPLLYVSSKA